MEEVQGHYPFLMTANRVCYVTYCVTQGSKNERFFLPTVTNGQGNAHRARGNAQGTQGVGGTHGRGGDAWANAQKCTGSTWGNARTAHKGTLSEHTMKRTKKR